jgi:hypothetical protein
MPTPVIGLETLVDGQNGAEIVVNEALYLVDAMLGGITQELNTPPAGSEGLAVVVGSAPTGVFASNAGEIAIYSNGLWSFYDVGPVRPFWSTTQNIDCEFVRDGSPVTSRVVSMGIGPNAVTKAVAHGITPNLAKPLKIEFFMHNGSQARYGTTEGLTILYAVWVDATNVNWQAFTDLSATGGNWTGWARLEFVD